MDNLDMIPEDQREAYWQWRVDKLKAELDESVVENRRLAELFIQTKSRMEVMYDTLHDIHTTAHCIAKAGPLNTPTLADAWAKFMEIGAMATNGLARAKGAQ